MSKRNPEKADVPVFALITATQRKALERLKIENQRSIGFLVREAIEQYLAAVKKASSLPALDPGGAPSGPSRSPRRAS